MFMCALLLCVCVMYIPLLHIFSQTVEYCEVYT